MSKAVVTFEDNDEDDTVNVRVEFGDEGAQETSGAHSMAVTAVHLATKYISDQYDDE